MAVQDSELKDLHREAIKALLETIKEQAGASSEYVRNLAEAYERVATTKPPTSTRATPRVR